MPRTRKQMGKEKNGPRPRKSAEVRYWKVAAILAILLCIALIVKIEMTPTPPQRAQTTEETSASPYGDLAQTEAQLVASEFECACGQCENTALTNCSCDFPHGALEEKNFIYQELKKGRSVQDVIRLLDRKYGHKIA